MPFMTKQKFADELHKLFVGDDTDEDQMKRGLLGDAMVKIESKGIDESKRQIRFLASAPELDRYNEVILVSAFKKKWLNLYKKNPVFLAGHVHVGPAGEPTVIGKAVDVYTDDKGLWMVIEFVPDDELADKYWKRYRGGYMNAVSIGFITHDWEYRAIEGTDQKRPHFTEVEVVELSGVAVPACRGALAKAMAAYGHLQMLGSDVSDLGGEVRGRLGSLIRNAEDSGIVPGTLSSSLAAKGFDGQQTKDVDPDFAAQVIAGLEKNLPGLIQEAVENEREETVIATLAALGRSTPAPAPAPGSDPGGDPGSSGDPETTESSQRSGGFTDNVRALMGD